MTLRIASRLVWQAVAGEVVVVDVEAGTMLGLDPVGSCLWPLLESCDEPQLVEAVLDGFEVDQETARRDVSTFLADLQARGLVQAA